MEHNEYARSVAEHVSTAIDESGMSLREVARRSGFSVSTLHLRTSGLGKAFDVDEVFRVAQALGVPSRSLYPDEVA